MELKDIRDKHDCIFSLALGDGPSREAKLIEAKALSPSTSGRGRSEPFSLLFHVAGDERLPDQIMRLSGPGVATEDVFMVAVDQDEQGFYYEAIFT